MRTATAGFDYIVVGSGAGGGTLVKELARRGKDVLCIERGSPVKKLGSKWDCRSFYDFRRLPGFLPKSMQKIPLLPPRTKEGVIMWRAIAAGGTSVVSLGNGARCMEEELASLGVDLREELAETEKEVGVQPLAERMLSRGSRAIRSAADSLGYNMAPMPKYINSRKCMKCHRCLYGCEYGAKWDTRPWLQDASENGARFMYDTDVREVSVCNGKARGVLARGPRGDVEIRGNNIVLAAGGMATPAILQRSGVEEAGGGFFLDVFWTTYGVTMEKGLNQTREPNMALVGLEWYKSDGFILSPYMNHDRLIRLQEMSPLKAVIGPQNMLGIMTKISDEANGKVYPDGSCSKPLTTRDLMRLRKGARIAREMLVKAGARPDSLFESWIQGAHPGGGAAIGTVVDTNLQTKIDKLFVCDASLLPGEAFNDRDRLPPILTIVALAKRLANYLP